MQVKLFLSLLIWIAIACSSSPKTVRTDVKFLYSSVLKTKSKPIFSFPHTPNRQLRQTSTVMTSTRTSLPQTHDCTCTHSVWISVQSNADGTNHELVHKNIQCDCMYWHCIGQYIFCNKEKVYQNIGRREGTYRSLSSKNKYLLIVDFQVRIWNDKWACCVLCLLSNCSEQIRYTLRNDARCLRCTKDCVCLSCAPKHTNILHKVISID